jgi:hypothetical protein
LDVPAGLAAPPPMDEALPFESITLPETSEEQIH